MQPDHPAGKECAPTGEGGAAGTQAHARRWAPSIPPSTHYQDSERGKNRHIFFQQKSPPAALARLS